MRFRENDVIEYIQKSGIDGMWEAIEYCSRVTTQSINKMGTIPSKEFVEKRLIKPGHGRALEFGTVYLHDTYDVSVVRGFYHSIGYKYEKNAYSKVVRDGKCGDFCNIYVTTNLRVLMQGDYETWYEAMENNFDKNWLDDLKYWTDEREKCADRRTFVWTISRVTADSFRTHITLSSIMESTRYNNYGKDKYDNCITYNRPWWLTNENIKNEVNYSYGDIVSMSEKNLFTGQEYEYLLSLVESEKHYLNLTQGTFGISPLAAEDARGVLPLDINVTFIQCGFDEAWINFIQQRFNGTTGKPQPNAKVISEKLHELFYNKNN